MKTVLKFQFQEGKNTITFDAHPSARLVHAGEQNGKVTIWVEFSDAHKSLALSKTMSFSYVGTGHDFPDEYIHEATVQMENGLVWHVYRMP